MTAKKTSKRKTSGTGRKTSGAGSSRRKNTTREIQAGSSLRGEIAVWIVLAFCVILLISNFGLGGRAGQGFSSFFFGLFGVPAYLAPFFLFFTTVFLIASSGSRRSLKKTAAIYGLIFSLCGLIQLASVPFEKTVRLGGYYAYSASEHRGGGFFGGILVRLLCPLFGRIGSFIILIILAIICLILITEKRVMRNLHQYGRTACRGAKEGMQRRREEHKVRAQEAKERPLREEKRDRAVPGRFSDTTLKKSDTEPMKELTIAHSSLPDPIDPVIEPAPEKESLPFEADPVMPEEQPKAAEEPGKQVTKQESAEAFRDVSEAIAQTEAAAEPARYTFPPLSLMKRGSRKKQGMSDAMLKETAAKLEQTLSSFGVRASVTNISCGPSVTRYELQPEVGVKVSRILSLTDDIKLNLAVPDIRIEAPIPGKAAIGIEVPNTENTSIMLRDLLESPDFKEHPSKIAFAVGMDIVGQIIVADIYKMPHLLIGGATGSGKSVCINTLIMSILYKARPDEVKFIMIDPKMIELNLYNGIPHLYIPVVTDPKKAAGALQWAVAEMTKRYKLFADLGVRDLKGYNAKVETLPPPEEGEEPRRKMPQIVIVVDEFADLMMVASGEVEEAVCRLAQLARAAGIHLILATQRPSVDVITGLIKANMPSRIALAVSSGVDSRTIIDMIGAEKLLGKGDMLFYPQGYPKPVRVQGAFVSEKEVEDVVQYIIRENGDAAYDAKIAEEVTSNASGCGKSSAGAVDTDGQDEYFAEAGRFIIEKDKASIGMLQRNFKIGFNRAARIMDALADAGVVGPEEGTKPRKILMNMEQFEQSMNEEDS